MVTHLSRTIPNGSLEEFLANVAVHVHSLVLYDIIIDIHLEVARQCNALTTFSEIDIGHLDNNIVIFRRNVEVISENLLVGEDDIVSNHNVRADDTVGDGTMNTNGDLEVIEEIIPYIVGND